MKTSFACDYETMERLAEMPLGINADTRELY